MLITFDHAERLGGQNFAFFFRPEGQLRFIPGQYINISLPHASPDKRGTTRLFTLISSPEDDLLGIAVNFPTPCSTFKRALLTIAPGDTAQIVGEPIGDFILPKDTSVPLVWVAGGIAAASFVSMANQLAKESAPRRIVMFQSAKTPYELHFGNSWQGANIPVQQTVTQASHLWLGRQGRFSAQDFVAAAEAQSSLERTLFYISGSEQMVEAICGSLLGEHVQNSHLVREAFTGY